MSPRPFRLVPRVTRTPQLGWTYLRWGRRLRRIPDDWAADLCTLALTLCAFGAMTVTGVALVAP